MEKNIVEILEYKRANGVTIYKILCNEESCDKIFSYSKKIKFSEIIQHLQCHKITNVQDHTTIKLLLKGTIRRFEHNKPPEEKIVELQFYEEEFITLKKYVFIDCLEIIRLCSKVQKLVDRLRFKVTEDELDLEVTHSKVRVIEKNLNKITTEIKVLDKIKQLNFKTKGDLDLLVEEHSKLQVIKKKFYNTIAEINYIVTDDNSSANFKYRLTSIQPIQDEYSTPKDDRTPYKRKRSILNLRF